MKKYSENEIEERYALLPENLKTALSGVDSIEKLKQIIEKHDLHVDHAGEIADAVELVLVGLMKVRDFESALYDALPLIDRAKVKAISDNVYIQTPCQVSQFTARESWYIYLFVIFIL